MNTKTIILSLLFSFLAASGFSQDVQSGGKSESLREIKTQDIGTINDLIGIKAAEILVSYKISLVNRGQKEVVVWEKGQIDESRLAQMIEGKKSDNCLIYIEDIVVKNPVTGENKEHYPIKARVK